MYAHGEACRPDEDRADAGAYCPIRSMVREPYDCIIGEAPIGAIPLGRVATVRGSLRRHAYAGMVEAMMSRRKSSAKPEGLSQLNLNAAGIDVGATSHFVAVPADRAEQPVQEFEAFVEAHGGRIWAESDGPGLGARFTFTIPVAQDAAIGAASIPVRTRRAERERTRILAVDDDPQTLRYVRDALTKAGYTPVVTGDPEEVSRLMAEERPRLVLLDLMLPGSDGMELMKEIREVSDVPVIFLSVNGQEETIARAFENGADDYVVKPFSPTELVARIKAALRKREAPEWAEPSEPYVLGELTIDYAERRVTLAGRPVQLTAIEYGLLFELSANAGRVMTYDRLLQWVWGLRRSGDSRRVRTAAKQLRRKLGDDANSPTYILNEPRVGYRMEKGEEAVTGEGAGRDGLPDD